eukprot:gnl/TRDRNA2_/TRDRNA2_81974_c1_seq2.p1 gnl/TRDRNA2_/TRDRNA2_81974_c1~~gnl/TRDRNA2_/TRDRNA2_81974_c1_seq2.p1  ORF type:complete len:152 (+),score=24.26 gnl/TRDRNA2_/TRDRNA2_81974_c1_seq2:123-578(+)
MNQFFAATLEPQKLRERRFARLVFNTLDLNGTGRIYAEELQEAIGDDCGVGPQGVDEQQFYKLLDRNASQVGTQLTPRYPLPSAPQLSAPPRFPNALVPTSHWNLKDSPARAPPATASLVERAPPPMSSPDVSPPKAVKASRQRISRDEVT